MRSVLFSCVMMLASIGFLAPLQASDDSILKRIRVILGTEVHEPTHEELLSSDLTTCLRLTAPDNPGPAIGFHADLGPQGTLIAPIALVAPAITDLTPEITSQIMRAEAAVQNCVPLLATGVPLVNTRLVMALEADRISVVDQSLLFQIPDILAMEELAEEEEAEPILELSSLDRREIQDRLRLAGFDPGKTDGVFGPRTLSALEGWQESMGHPVTGRLTGAQLVALRDSTEAEFEAFKTTAEAKPVKRRKKRVKYVRREDGCLRYAANGRIVPRQSFKCDAKGLLETF